MNEEFKDFRLPPYLFQIPSLHCLKAPGERKREREREREREEFVYRHMSNYCYTGGTL
jgi:hypothetical protein